MYLVVGKHERVEDPTPEQISHHLRNPPGDAPFLILNADDGGQFYFRENAPGGNY